MPVIFNSDGKLYSTLPYENESDFEDTVVELADQIFGPETIYIDIKKRVSGKDIVTIPDGYLIDMTVSDNPRLFIIPGSSHITIITLLCYLIGCKITFYNPEQLMHFFMTWQ